MLLTKCIEIINKYVVSCTKRRPLLQKPNTLFFQ